MKLPHGDRAHVDVRKLTEYALNKSHPIGKEKARVFEAIGITMSNPGVLLDALLYAAASSEDAVLQRTDGYGERYQLDFALNGATVRSGWICKVDEIVPTLTTCYVLPR